ncbi:phosphate acyltransferase PlsX [candidate division WOR-3 bacterium]|nr:phosphate acyltransferase PlsX [candidate division WOR-3 bacterium]
MRVALDAMGSDSAPRAELEGVAQALEADDSLEVTLVGREDIAPESAGPFGGRLEFVPAADVVGMHESPTDALKRKSGSSIAAAMRLLAEGRADAVVSAGNTGAVMAFAVTTIGVVAGVHRPTLGILFPNIRGSTLVLDVGANVDCKPRQLFQFGLMGATAASHLFHKANPTVGLLNIGREDAKGNELTLAAHGLLKSSALNFVGNVEGNDILKGTVDVAVCDGFVGNVLLKYAEGLAEVVAGMLDGYLESESKYRLRRWLSKPVLHEFIGRMDYQEHGGALMLGVKGPVVVAHGRSTARAIKNALRTACQAARDNLAGHIARRFTALAEAEE